MLEELDELEGNTAKGKIICAAVFILTLAISFGILAGMIKLNAGGVASDVLAPYIANVPILRSILPADMQEKSAAELAAEQAQAQAEAEALAAEQAQAQADAHLLQE